MKTPACLDEDTLLQLSLGHLAEAEASPARVHVEGCPHCRAELAEIGRLGAQLAASSGGSKRTVDEIVSTAMMADSEGAGFSPPRWLMAMAAVLIVLAAGASLVLRGSEFTARGGLTPWSDRVVAKVVAAPGGATTGSRISRDALFTASVFGLGPSDSLYLTAFLIDSVRQLHWVSPTWLDAAAVPTATPLATDGGPSLVLETAVQFDDLTSGGAVAVTLVTAKAVSVEEIERMPVIDEASLRRMAGSGAIVRLTTFEVIDVQQP